MLGRVEPKMGLPSIRVWSLSSYSLLLVYNATTDPVRILRIVHTSRDLPKALKNLGS